MPRRKKVEAPPEEDWREDEAHERRSDRKGNDSEAERMRLGFEMLGMDGDYEADQDDDFGC